MKGLVIIFALLMAVNIVWAADLNSTDYRIVGVILDGGGENIESTDYKLFASIDSASEFSSAPNRFLCVGYLCLSLEQVTGRAFVTFMLDLNISGTTGDVAQVDNRGPGFFTPLEINKMFTCIEDTGITNKPTFGIVFSGRQLNYIELENSTDTYIMRMSQLGEENRFLLPVTTTGCSAIGDKLPLLSLVPFVPTGEAADAIEMFLSYPFTDIVGNFEKTGRLTLILEKNETNQIVVDVI